MVNAAKLFLVVLTFSTVALAQDQRGSFSKGAIVTPKFSDSLVGFQAYSLWDGHAKHSTSVSQSSDGKTVVNGDLLWQDKGWPFRAEYSIKEIDSSKKGTKVTLRRGNNEIQVFFDPGISNLNRAMNDVFFNGNFLGLQQTEYYQNDVIDRFVPRIFRGVLVNIPQKDKIDMLSKVDYDTNAYGVFDYKEKQYLLAVINSTTDYNTIRVSESQRVATVIKTRLIDFIRFLHPKIKQLKSIDGMKLSTAVMYRDFVREATDQKDSLEIYIPTEETGRFLEAEITIQELINKSIVLLNGNRIQANLDNAL